MTVMVIFVPGARIIDINTGKSGDFRDYRFTQRLWNNVRYDDITLLIECFQLCFSDWHWLGR